MTTPISLVIFDCDGVLVDSEMLSAGILKTMMAEIGLPITDEIFRQDFLGRSFANAAIQVGQRFGCSLPADFQLRYRDRLLKRMETKLKPMLGMAEVLSSMRVPICLATGSSPERLAVSLRTTNLERFFAGRCFTTSQVELGKPAPDVFFLAMQNMGNKPENCLVLEDSEMGIRAGLASGAQVWHFAGGAHIKAGYHLPPGVTPHRSIDDCVALHSAFLELGLCH